VAEIAASIAVKSADAILDCCAAPGGKTFILAERNPQARIVACESSPQRHEQLRKRLAPLGDRVECRLADATVFNELSRYDLVLADVPCSGTGTLGRNPEIRHRLQIQDFARQSERQRAILESAVNAVRTGGNVVYSTCSLEPEENEHVVAAVVQYFAKLRIVPLGPHIDAMNAAGILTNSGALALRSSVTPEGYLRLMPGQFGTDGFFIACLQKISN
jgi:16S rRNA (cytosine967-C5)-methyltransferase